MIRVIWDSLCRWWNRGPDHGAACQVFLRDAEELQSRFLETARQQGRPRGLEWLSLTPNGEPIFAREGRTLRALMPLLAHFEPLPEGDLADVPQAREPRTIHALWQFRNGWQTDGRAIFNLTAEQILTQARWERVNVPR